MPAPFWPLPINLICAKRGNKHTRLASEAELVLAYPMYELGAVPPFGMPAGDRLLFDRQLAQRDTVVVEAGVHDKSLRLKTAELLAITHAEVGDLARDARVAAGPAAI